MLDAVNEVFQAIATKVRSEHPGTTVRGEFLREETEFPAVSLDEVRNVAVDYLEDSSNEERYAGVTYRLQTSSNKQGGRKAEARAIFATADAEMRRLGLRRVSYTTTPDIYNSTVYSITATYEGVISAEGYVYSR